MSLICMKEEHAAELAYVCFIAASSGQLISYSKCTVVVMYKLAGSGQSAQNPARLETQRSILLITPRIKYNKATARRPMDR